MLAASTSWSEEWSVTGLLVTGILGLLTGWYLYHRMTNRRLYQLAAKLPGPPGLPILGNIVDFIGGPDRVFRNFYEKSFKYENVVRMWAGPRLFVFITHPSDIELILSSHIHIDKAPEYSFFEPWLGNGLLISTGEKWRSHRKLIAPTFHVNVLKSFLDLFNANSKALNRRLADQVGRTFDCHDLLSQTTVEILLETAMGVNKKTQESGFDYAMAVMKMCDILHLRQTKIWMRPELLFQLSSYGRLQTKLLGVIHGLTQKVLKIRKEQMIKGKKDRVGVAAEAPKKEEAVEEAAAAEGKGEGGERAEEKLNKAEEKFSFGHSLGLKDDLDVDENDIGEKKRMAFLDLLLEGSQNGGILTDEEIQNQVDTIMFEGHDTTAACSSFFLCMMAARPDIQEKCVEELNEIFGGSDRDVTFQDTLEMKYLERCIMETLRMYPPVPVIARELQQELQLASCDLVIPANCTVIVTTFKTHRRHDIYVDPETFDPDNFLPERSATRHYYSYIPFSAGPRSCVGRKYAMLKLKVLLATILREYRIVGGSLEKDWVLQADIILKRTDGFNVQVEPRRRAATN